jgi:pimeloyl-[acyl-carrier protein] synthase
MAEPTTGGFPDIFPFLRPEFLADPYPVYALLRATQPVLRIPLPGTDAGGFVLTRHEDVQALLRDARFSVDRRRSEFMQRNRDALSPALAQALLGEQGGLRSMLIIDPPDHTRVRGLVSKAFTPRHVARLRGHIESICDELLAAVDGRGRMDAMADLATQLPAIVIAELLGVPARDRMRFKEWSNDLISVVGNPDPAGALERFERGLDGLLSYLREVIAERRREPRDDLISGMIAAQEERDALTDAELLATSNLLLVAGHETTTNLIGNGLLALLRHPDQMGRLREDPGLVPGAVEEMLRWDSPVQATIRVATTTVEVGGQTVAPGALVVAMIGAANRDPVVFPEPDRLDVTRADNRHLSFGFGPHFCLGAPLARLEGEVVFRKLLARYPEMRLGSGEIRHRPNFALRGLLALPVELGS